MNYFVVDRGDQTSVQLAEQFHQLMGQYGMTLSETEPDVVLSIGGDGTMLQAFHRFNRQLGRISFIGIHTGRLGFLTDWQPDEIEELANLMHVTFSNGTARLVEYPLLEIQVTTNAGTETHLVLNEFTLKGIEETMVAQLNVNDAMFEMFRGDGICLSTPSGSTAYNKSLNGALIHPSIEAMQIAEIASINNRVYRTLGSSMILPKHHHCDIYPMSRKPVMLTFDHRYEQRTGIESIRCMVSEQKIRFARLRPFPFWQRVQEAFIDFAPKD